MIGDLQSDIALRPALSPRVNIAAAKQADTILEYVCNKIFYLTNKAKLHSVRL